MNEFFTEATANFQAAFELYLKQGVPDKKVETALYLGVKLTI